MFPSQAGKIDGAPIIKRKRIRARRHKLAQRHLFVGLVLLNFLLASRWCLKHFGPLFSGVSSREPTDVVFPSKAFPLFGTAEFERRCPWIRSSSLAQKSGDTIYVTILPESDEGLAQWLSGLVSGFLLSKLVSSNLVVDFGSLVEIYQIMEPINDEYNWTIPSNFACQKRCRKMYGLDAESGQVSFDGEVLPRIPVYRHAAQTGNIKHVLRQRDFLKLQESLPGFRLNDGFACAFQSLVRLSPHASEYQPNLFTKILPALSDSSTIPLTLYIRTGYTDQIADAEKAGVDVPLPADSEATTPTKSVTDCALELEARYLEISKRQSGIDTPPIYFTWLVISDSMTSQEWVVSEFSTETRQVLTTQSRGRHTKPGSHPSTVDFAEAFLDWYLLGESQAVITSNRWYTFGFTGSLRTSRPFYEALSTAATGIRAADAPKCSLVTWAQS